MISRKDFIKSSSVLVGGAVVNNLLLSTLFIQPNFKTKLCAHLWVYASKYPPDWDATPILDQVFSDLSYAGFEGIELMEVMLRHDDALERLNKLSAKYKIGVSGTSYNGQMWDRERHDAIMQDVVLITKRLRDVGGKTFGISVGDARRKKTDTELDAQAEVLKEIINISEQHGITPNLHNHTYELRDDMYDFKETISRVPHLKLGPDLNWLIRGGIDPVWFIENYGDRMVYMHIRDQKADGKWTEAVGEGNTDFSAIAKALKKINYNGWAAVELAFDAPTLRPVRENWKLSRNYVRKVFGY